MVQKFYCCDFCNILLVIQCISLSDFLFDFLTKNLLLFSYSLLHSYHDLYILFYYYSFYMSPLGAETECKDFSTTFFFLLEINFAYKLSSIFSCVFCEIFEVLCSSIFTILPLNADNVYLIFFEFDATHNIRGANMLKF